MHKIRQMVRLIINTMLGNDEIAHTVDVSRNTVQRYREIAAEENYTWKELENLSDDALDARFNSVLRRAIRKRLPDFAHVHAEMQEKGVTRLLLWEEYRESHPDDGMSYSQFTEHYRRHVQSLDRVMRQTHQPGHKAFLDFSGKRPKYIQRETGEEVYVELFVAVLGYSNYTFATAVPSQKIPDWIDANNQMFDYFGGAPYMLVPDNLKSAVITPGLDPALNRTYQEQAEHYGTAIVPARSRRPQDKGSVEVGVQIGQRWILAKMRHMTFFSIEEMNAEIAKLLELLNTRKFKRLSGCRRSRFNECERAVLLPLPAQPYVLAEWTGLLLVDTSYHVSVDRHWYSVPHRLVGQRVSARTSSGRVEIFHKNVRVASHGVSNVIEGHTTDPEHLTDNHRAYAERTPEKYRAWASTIGPHVMAVVENQFARHVPVLGLPACDVLQKLVRTHGAEEVESAARRASEIQSLTVKSVKSLLSSGRHRRSRKKRSQSSPPLHHANVRGGAYYRQED